MGRQKKHTAASLKRGVAAYFRKITYDQPMVMRMPEENDAGEAIFRNRIAYDDEGRPITKKAWMATPSIADLALHLGVHRSTLWEYRKDPELGPIVESAKSWTEAYWTEQLGVDNKGALERNTSVHWDGLFLCPKTENHEGGQSGRVVGVKKQERE